MELHYWGIRARNYVALAIAQAGKLDLKECAEVDMAALKPVLPFGQLPYLVDGDVKIAQTGAIIRYIAHKAGLEGESDVDWAKSEMLVEEYTDLYNIMNKAFYAPEGKEAGFDKTFAAGGPIHVQLGYLENLLNGPYFGSKALAGDYAIACALDLIEHLEPGTVSGYPMLSAFFKTMLASSAFDKIKAYPVYFQRR